MISSLSDDAEEQKLECIVQKSRLQNTAILIKSASCSPGSPPHLRSIHGESRFPVLHALLRQCLIDGAKDIAAGKRMVIAVQGKKDLETTCMLVNEALKDDMSFMNGGLGLVHGLQGHADIVEFSRLWRQAFADHRILLTTSQSLLFLFSHGLLRMNQLTHLFFDDCTMANANHPYCTIMKSFYLPRRAQLLKEALEVTEADSGEASMRADELIGLPRIILFADWPLVREGEGFLEKRDRISKMLQYLRLFQTVIRPLAAELRAPDDSAWLSYEELIYLKDAGCFEQLQSIFLAPGEEGLSERLVCVAEGLRTADGADILVLLQPDNLQAAAGILKRACKISSELLSPSVIGTGQDGGRVLLHTMADDGLPLLTYYLQQQQGPFTLAAIYVAEAGLAPSLLLTLMSYAKQIPVISIRNQSPAALHQQALEMAIWMAAIGAASPVDSGPFRKLRAFVGGYEAIAQQAYLLATDSPVHHWIPETGALISTATSISMLLCCCSYLPHLESAGTGLRIHTMAVKRVSAEGAELDRDRHFYMTQITLPPCLLPWLGEEGKRHIHGPLTPSRFSSQTLAASATLKLLHESKVLDDHLMIAEPVLKALLGDNYHEGSAMLPGSTEAKDLNDNPDLGYNPFENEEIDGEGPSRVQELSFANALDTEKSQGTDRKKSKAKRELFYCYAFHYEMGLLDETERFKPTGIKTGADEHIIMQEEDMLPVDTLIHLCDDSFLNTDRGSRTFALMMRRPLTMAMHPVALRIGANVLLKGTLEPVGVDGCLELTAEQVKTLKDFQALTFGIISVKQYQLSPLQDKKNPDSIEGEDLVMNEEERHLSASFKIPDDKQSLFFVGLAVKTGTAPVPEIHDHEATLDAYKRFMGRVGERLGSQLNQGISEGKTAWELDWQLMESAVHQDSWPSLHDYLTSLQAFSAERAAEIAALGPAPVFDYPNDPSRLPLTVDLCMFALRRLVLYAPYNGLYYRAKCLEDDLTASSPFASTSVPEAQTYADYVQLRYRLSVRHPDSPLVQVKRIENFASLGRWIQKTSRSAQSGQRRHRVGRFEQTKSDLIPELVRIIPLPYALVRMAMLIPKASHDIERQALIHDFYAKLLPSVLDEPTVPLLPPSPILVDSMTGPTASLTYDFERLEILGDSFLKLAASIDVFLSCPPSANEGKLSSKRQELVCNATLYDIATRLDIYRYARLTPFFAKLWCPPDLIKQFDRETMVRFPYIPLVFDEGEQRWRLIWEADERAGRRSALHHLLPDGTLVDRGRAAGEHIVLVGAAKHQRHKSTPANTPVLSRFGQPLPPKAMADLLEAIIGAVYKVGGYNSGLRVLRGLGILSDLMETHRDINPEEAIGAIRAAEPAHPKSFSGKIVVPEGLQKMSDVAPYAPSPEDYPYEEIEAALGYKFRSRRLLFVAMTHASIDVTFSNERLEWLGDAILDWIITEYYWEEFGDAKWMTPARITSCRQAAVCNEAFSRIAVHAGGLHRFLRIDAPFLQLEIQQYVQAVMAVEDGPEGADPEGPLSALSWSTRYDLKPADASTVKAREEPAERGVPRLSIPPAPKALGDLFEGIAGAVFLDLGFDVQAFSRIFLPLIRWYLDRHADPYDLPENPISDFWHDYLAAGVPPTAIEFRYCEAAEMQQRLFQSQSQQGDPAVSFHPEKASTATCQILVRGRIVAEATAPTRQLARKFATRQAVVYIRSSGWRDFLS